VLLLVLRRYLRLVFRPSAENRPAPRFLGSGRGRLDPEPRFDAAGEAGGWGHFPRSGRASRRRGWSTVEVVAITRQSPLGLEIYICGCNLLKPPHMDLHGRALWGNLINKDQLYVERRSQGDYAVRRLNSARASDVKPTQRDGYRAGARIESGRDAPGRTSPKCQCRAARQMA
jgi:hypothetical protein